MLALCGVAFALPAVYWGTLRQNYCLVYLFQHSGTNAALCLVFGRTLLNGRQPLCSRLAILLHGTLSPERGRYTRQVTVAWTIYFASMASISVLLFFLVPIPVWSVFANLLNPLFVALMFVGEYAIRLRVLPGMSHTSLIRSAQAFWQSPPSSSDRHG